MVQVRILGVVAMLSLGGCDLLLAIAGGLSNVVRTQPRLVYAEQLGPVDARTTRLRAAVVSGETDAALIFQTLQSALPNGSVRSITLSPDARYAALQFLEEGAVFEFSTQINNVETGARELFHTDNTLESQMSELCKAVSPDLQSAIAAWPGFIEDGVVAPGSMPDLGYLFEDPNNEVVFGGWGSGASAVLRLKVTVQIVSVQSNGNRVPLGGETDAVFFLTVTRGVNGTWPVTACALDAPSIQTGVPERAITLGRGADAGFILLDGQRLTTGTGGTVISDGQAVAVSGAWRRP